MLANQFVLSPERPWRRTSDRTATVTQLSGDTDLLTVHALAPERYPVLLESSGGSAELGRFDILMAFPGEKLVLDPDWALLGPWARRGDNDFLRTLDRWWRAEVNIGVPAGTHLPFHGGWFLFLAYELGQQVERGSGLASHPDSPVAMAVRIPAAVIRDRLQGEIFVVTEPGCDDLLAAILTDLEAVRLGHAGRPGSPARLVREGSIEEGDPQAFLDGVRRVREHISAGNVYQSNISREWHAELQPGAVPWMLYERLRQTNPAPFGGVAMLGSATLVSSSPERLVRVRAGRIETRPIAGTRPRLGRDEDQDLLRHELLGNPKERAEHVMLIDLERNDLGRICEAGTVGVDEFMTVESYAHVHHIVSSVVGTLRPLTGPGDVLRAVFPGGTITGCPKIRCMQIIREVERRPRGPYTGAIGYLNHDLSCDFNILIRTMVVANGRLTFAAGSGIVADSDPQLELGETRSKAKGMLLSLDAAIPAA